MTSNVARHEDENVAPIAALLLGRDPGPTIRMLVGKRARFMALHTWITRQPGCQTLSEAWLRAAISREVTARGPLPIEPDLPVRTADGDPARWMVDPVRENARVLAQRRKLDAYFCSTLVALVLDHAERGETEYAINLVARAAEQVERAGRDPGSTAEVIRRFTALAPSSPAQQTFDIAMVDRLGSALARRRRPRARAGKARSAVKAKGMVRLSPAEQKRRQAARNPVSAAMAPYVDERVSTSVRTVPGSYGAGKRR